MLKNQEIKHLIDMGDHWKAKEKLQGRLATQGYDAELFEEYGNVLLAMSDKLEAGKYLFLSGSRKAAYSESIMLFTHRYSKKDASAIFHSFPKKVQRARYSDYPEIVRNELELLDVKPKNLKAEIDHRQHKKSLKDRVAEGGCFLVMVLLVIAFGVGVFSGMNTLIELLFGRT